ncbi:sporulation integral membrane protein YtvI [Pontibacillus sp. ALD_SL1]|uniref:sporulation integral membrane protein YtvI n=1 Tax=Pontibacillus sp. ALD_SL1 TaxID=2777185 RepID=UPI001A974187|nr:sporulation integral membrane protein YtvI [Pontibacillus sp. ALD_SL1]QST01872.1 sporulation integral membrane protein YtvI [Pontibacillus sp. ALD_SL1]
MFRYMSKKHWILIFLTIILIIGAYFILPVSLPLLLAFFTALFLNPLVRWLQYKFRFKRKLSVIIVYITFLIIVGLVGSLLVTKAVTQVINVANNAPVYFEQVEDFFDERAKDTNQFVERFPTTVVEEVSGTLKDKFDTYTSEYKVDDQLKKIGNFLAEIPNYLVSFIVYLIALFLFMLEIPKLKAKAYDHMTSKTAEKVRFMNSRLSYVVFGFLKAQFLVSIIIFVVSLIGLLYISPKVAILMSLIIWAIDFIPIIGSIAVLGPWALYAFIVGDIAMGTQLSILAIVLLAIRRTVEPKVMGRHIGLSPLATLIAMYLGLKLIGVLGFFIGPFIVIAFNSAKEAGIIKFNYKI